MPTNYIVMQRKIVIYGLSSMLLLTTSCASHYHLADISRSRILICNRYDAAPDAEAAAFVAPYRHDVDSIMGPVVGATARYLSAYRPESPLSNLVADILMFESARFNEKPDFAVYNMGGVRSAFEKGLVTYGDVVDVAPFENKICFLSLRGDKVIQLFEAMAMTGGECVSHGVELVFSKRKLMEACLNDSKISPDSTYRIVTLNYLAQGNDNLEAFKNGTDVVSPEDEKNNVRYLIVDYFRKQQAKGELVDSKIEGRIVNVDNYDTK